jgi:hypothetical protein
MTSSSVFPVCPNTTKTPRQSTANRKPALRRAIWFRLWTELFFTLLWFWPSKILFPSLPYFPVTASIIKLKLVQSLKKFLIALSLQLLNKARQKFAGFGLEEFGLLQGVKMPDDSSKGRVKGRESFVNLCLLDNIKGSHCRLVSGALVRGVSAFVRWRVPLLPL